MYSAKLHLEHVVNKGETQLFTQRMKKKKGRMIPCYSVEPENFSMSVLFMSV